MTAAKLRLALAAVLFVGWIGYLAYLVIAYARPAVDLKPLEITKTQYVVLSRSQFLVADLDVSVELNDKTNLADAPLKNYRVLWSSADDKAPKNDEPLEIENLAQCKDDWSGPGRYLIPLIKSDGHYFVALIPSTPGYPARSPGRPGPPRIYADTAQTRRQLQEIRGLKELP